MRAHSHDEPADFDPFEVLGISKDASDRQVSKAFLAMARKYPPDRHPEEFARVQRAHKTLRDPVARAGMKLEEMKPALSMDSLMGELSTVRERVGVEPWLDLLRRSK